jgi:hypothetical protein
LHQWWCEPQNLDFSPKVWWWERKWETTFAGLKVKGANMDSNECGNQIADDSKSCSKNMNNEKNNIHEPKLSPEASAQIELFEETLLAVADALRNIIIPTIVPIIEHLPEIMQNLEKSQLSKFKFKREILNQWNNLEKELKTQNRYFPKSKLIDLFKEYTQGVKYILHKDSILYRARKIEVTDPSCGSQKIIKMAEEKLDSYECQKYLQKEMNILDYIENITHDELERDYMSKFPLKEPNFWGFNKKDSGAPPQRETTHGRINPAGISYLYTAIDINTAIAEIQPTIEQTISIAKIKTLKELNIFNFDFSDIFENSNLDEKTSQELEVLVLEVFFDTVSELFSKPVLGNADKYYTTQYISEYIKHMGFDGIKYKSSLRKNGLNIVLFDTSENNGNYEILSSSLYRVTNVEITSKKILPKEKANITAQGRP